MTNVAVLKSMLDILWQQYKLRVPYAAQYQDMVEKQGGNVQNDHLAFRTFNAPTGAQPAGVEAIARIFTALGYEQKDRYIFTEKKLTAWHYEHRTDAAQPKIFISQLEVDSLPTATAVMIKEAVKDAPDLLAKADRDLLKVLATGTALSAADTQSLARNLAAFFARPWQPPLRSVVESVNKDQQYGAWTLLHGNAVNHFTAYINFQNVKAWPDLEATANALRAAGIPMKDEFEGEKGSKLRQTSTKAAMENCTVMENDGQAGRIDWSYAYYELAERGMVPGLNGKPVLFQGFLGEQATNLFEMTKL